MDQTVFDHAAHLKDGEEARLPAGPVSHDHELEAVLQNCGVTICAWVKVRCDMKKSLID